jgi:hypothetical protein
MLIDDAHVLFVLQMRGLFLNVWAIFLSLVHKTYLICKMVQFIKVFSTGPYFEPKVPILISGSYFEVIPDDLLL